MAGEKWHQSDCSHDDTMHAIIGSLLVYLHALLDILPGLDCTTKVVKDCMYTSQDSIYIASAVPGQLVPRRSDIYSCVISVETMLDTGYIHAANTMDEP